MTAFVRFPRTPHLALLGSTAVRTDKVLSLEERSAFLGRELVVEEKVDGENLGLSVAAGRLLAQSRGSYVEPGGASFRGLRTWLQPRASRIASALGEDLVLFGEWCAVRHTVAYDALPDWLMVFDVYDRRQGGFLPLGRRNLLARCLGLSVVPRLAAGEFDLPSLEAFLGMSRVGSAQMEGLVLRHASSPDDRAKLVRPEFLRQTDLHWRLRAPERNRLATVGVRR